MNSKANGVWALSLLLFATGTMFLSKRPTSVVASPEDRRLQERQAIQRSVLLLESSARQWHADCVSCHHHALELITVNAAQVQHFEVDNALLRDQQRSLQQALARSESKMAAAINSTQRPAMQVSPNPAMIFGYSLFALAETHVQRGQSTETALRYLTLIQEQTGNWRSQVKQRPPFEASDFAATALMVKAGREYAPPDRAATAEKAADSATRWLISTKPEDTEDRTFRLLGLHWAGAPRENTVSAGRELLLQQRADGGWPQTSALASDAYATGEALVALRAAGIVPNNDPAFKNGIDFLLRTQAADGSWHVRSRAQPIQTYFETGFPYGRDQFISYTATCWATLAMLSDGELDVSPIQ